MIFIGNCSLYCPICDEIQPFEGIRPVVCNKEDCVWRYEELGLGASISAEINNCGDLVDLLISMCLSALNSGRADKIFQDSFPSDFVVKNNGKTVRDFDQMKQIITKLPSLTELKGKDLVGIKALVEPIHPKAYHLLRWIITSNRSHLVSLPESKHIKEMSTPHQYMLLMSTPEKEAKFNELKNNYGSFYAWHGSPMENWHAILRSGLKNLSNKTGYMLHGAAHGPGIYLAPNSGTSGSYMRSGKGWEQSQFGPIVSCLALCEVINHPSVKGRDHKQWCYVVENEEFVMTRFFFIYGSRTSMPSNLNARDISIPDVVSQFGNITSPKTSKSWWKRFL